MFLKDSQLEKKSLSFDPDCLCIGPVHFPEITLPRVLIRTTVGPVAQSLLVLKKTHQQTDQTTDELDGGDQKPLTQL